MRDDALPDFFALLYGRQEYTEFSTTELRDRRVPDYGYNVFNQTGELYTPVVDHAHLDRGGSKPEWPNDAAFAVCLTHDLDNVSKYNPRHDLRSGIARAKSKLQEPASTDYLRGTGRLSALKSLAGSGLSAARSGLQRGKDPLHCFERWLAVEDEFNARSTFFVLPQSWEQPHASDPDYRYSDRVVFDGTQQTVAEMVREISERGWEIGLHPTWYAYDNAGILSTQRAELADVINTPVKSVRQHYLHYDPRRTPAAHDAAGFSFDATLGFNKNVGFRRGSSYPWQAKDIESGEELDLFEVPMTVQDTALFRECGLGLDPEHALEYVTLLAERTKEVGGVLLLSWHPSAVADDDRFEVYEQALSQLDEMGAWFGSVKEVGEWWQKKGVEHTF